MITKPMVRWKNREKSVSVDQMILIEDSRHSQIRQTCSSPIRTPVFSGTLSGGVEFFALWKEGEEQIVRPQTLDVHMLASAIVGFKVLLSISRVSELSA